MLKLFADVYWKTRFIETIIDTEQDPKGIHKRQARLDLHIPACIKTPHLPLIMIVSGDQYLFSLYPNM